MNRRDFIKTAAVAGIGATFLSRLAAAENTATNTDSTETPDLVAVQNGEPAAMLDAALAPLGGIAAFVKPGQTVVVKPNIGWHKKPEEAADTNPDLVGHLVKLCFAAGAKQVYVFDHTCDRDWKGCYETSGIAEAVRNAGGTMLCGNIRSDYAAVELPNGKTMKSGELFKPVRDCDVFINVPILKNHGGAKLTCCLKNLMGTVWNRGEMHKLGLQQAIADWAFSRKPDLNIVDAYRAMQTGGPRGNAKSIILMPKALLVSRDMVAADTAAARMIGIPLTAAAHIGCAEAVGLGTTKLDSIRIRKITLG